MAQTQAGPWVQAAGCWMGCLLQRVRARRLRCLLQQLPRAMRAEAPLLLRPTQVHAAAGEAAGLRRELAEAVAAVKQAQARPPLLRRAALDQLWGRGMGRGALLACRGKLGGAASKSAATQPACMPGWQPSCL